MKTKKVLIIGGPGTGKSSVLHELEKRQFTCFHEIAREVILQAQQEGIEQLFLKDPLLFSKKLLEGRIQQFKEANESEENIVFIDRGIPDIIAYLDYKKDDYPACFLEASQNYTYDEIFIFPLWEEIYKSDNERYEDFEEAKTIQHYLVKTYTNLGYNPIEVPKDSIENRTNFILKKLAL